MFHRHRVRSVPIFLMLLGVLCGCGIVETQGASPAPTAAAEQVRARAERELRNEFTEPGAQLGEPYRTYALNLGSIRSYRANSRVAGYLPSGYHWEFPVLVNDDVIGTISVGATGSLHGISRGELKDWEMLRAFLALPQHTALGTPVLVNCFPPTYGQFALFNKGFDEQILPLGDWGPQRGMYPAPDARQVFPPREIIPDLIKAAHDGDIW